MSNTSEKKKNVEIEDDSKSDIKKNTEDDTDSKFDIIKNTKIKDDIKKILKSKSDVEDICLQNLYAKRFKNSTYLQVILTYIYWIMISIVTFPILPIYMIMAYIIAAYKYRECNYWTKFKLILKAIITAPMFVWYSYFNYI